LNNIKLLTAQTDEHNIWTNGGKDEWRKRLRGRQFNGQLNKRACRNRVKAENKKARADEAHREQGRNKIIRYSLEKK